MKNKNILNLILVFTTAFVFVLGNDKVLAEDGVDPSSIIEFQNTALQERESLEEELKQLEIEISKYEEDITKTSQQKKTLQNQISILKKKIDKLNLQIYQSNILIKDLGLQIKDTEYSIGQTSLKIKDSQKNLSNILQLISEKDQRSVIEILLSEKEFSDFFDDLMALESLGLKSQDLLKDIKNLKVSLENQKGALDEEKADLEKVVKLTTLQKQESEATKKETDSLLKLTESEYQEQLKKKETAQKRVAEIKARIFELIGVPEAPTFGEALEIAKYVETVTGVSPALLLAVMTQESNIGKNVGQCFLKNFQTGSGVVAYNGKEVQKVMSPSRDVPYFLQITQELGRDPYNTPVSCPMSVGWGGAMGPAQFIPDTWGNPKYGYGIKVKEVTGKAADPWNIKDAFLAAGLYLRDLGAIKNEFNAVMRYFSGSSWSKWEEFYGKSVLAIKARYQEDIKEIEGI